MTDRSISSDLIKTGGIVGAVHSPASLRAARRLPSGVVDLLELRVDHFAEDPAPLLRAAGRLKSPIIVTVRHPAEGGQHGLTAARRRELFAQFLPVAAAIDVELRSVGALGDILGEAAQRGIVRIISAHDFRTTPSSARLRATVRAAVAAGADVVKIAARADRCADVQRLLTLFSEKFPVPLSLMGMGRLGKGSRLLFAQAGSVLNYAYLGTANASGQWSAREFRDLLTQLAA
jgi:3-dehydroquinate dehydratase-1